MTDTNGSQEPIEVAETVQPETEAPQEPQAVAEETNAAGTTDEIDAINKAFRAKIAEGDIDGAEMLLDELKLKKRQGYHEAQKHRETADSLRADLQRKDDLIEQIRSEKVSETNDEIKQLQERLQALEQEKQDALNLAQAERNKQADIKLKHAAEKHAVASEDYLDFIKGNLQKHLSAQPAEALDQFDIDTWMTDQKAKYPVMFGGQQPKEPATTGITPQGSGAQTNYDYRVSPKPSRNDKDRKALDSEWSQFKTTLPGQA